jgi:demethylmenaquinone methyltransferase/2-methoxy-6-polyprenyl-1,4-benzoquinol methylase
MKEIKPDQHSEKSKREQVEEMFNNIAPKYDLLNRVLSLGIDKGWRKKAIKMLEPIKPKVILDVATGTGDLALAAMSLNPDKIIGADIAQGMLDIGKLKSKRAGYDNKIEFINADSAALPFANNSFDAIMVAFGVRNFQHLDQGLAEMYRVLKPGGRMIVLEFSKPSGFPYKQFYNFYFSSILPIVGNLYSKSSNAYSYLPESVKHFPEGDAFAAHLEKCNFKNILINPLTFGTCTLYTADK